MKRWPFKDPDEVLDFEVDWTARLDGDTISAVTWTVPVGLTKTAQNLADPIAIVWLSGGTAGQSYEIGCRVETAGGRTYDETISLPVRSR